MALEYFPCYYSYRKKIAKLSDQEVGRLFRRLLEYGETGETEELAGREAVAFDFIADDIDRAKDKYDELCDRNRANGSSGRQRSVAVGSGRQRSVAVGSGGGQTEYKDETEYKTEYKDETKEETEDVCTVPETAAVLTLPLVDGTEYPITDDDVQEWQELYPAVDIMQELRKMRGWCISHPAKRKTRRGIKAFINSWLAKEQDKGGSTRSQPYTSAPPVGRNDWMKDVKL